MTDVGEDLASKLRRVLDQHRVDLESAAVAKVTVSSSNSSEDFSSDSSDPTLSYISRMLLDDASDEEEGEQQSSEQCQVLMNEFTTIIDSPGPIETGFISTPVSGTVDFHWALMECARAVAANNTRRFFTLIAELKRLISSVPNATERAAVLLIDALTARLKRTGAQTYRAMAASISTRRVLSMTKLNLPLFTITHQFANEMILRACVGAKRVHIVDYGILSGLQWPSLIKALAERPETAPQLRITGIEHPSTAEAFHTGQHLTEYANAFGLKLVFDMVSSSSWESVQPILHAGETLIVNCNLRAGMMKDDFMAVSNPRRLLLEAIHKMRPGIFVHCCWSAALNNPFFLPRFEEAMRLTSNTLECQESWMGDQLEERRFLEKIVAKSVMNIVACDGADWTERPESYRAWDSRARRAGLVQVPLDDEIYNKMKLVWGGFKNTSENFCCGRDRDWMLLGWKNSVIIGMSAWRPRTSGQVSAK